jgi:hypothetical protein
LAVEFRALTTEYTLSINPFTQQLETLDRERRGPTATSSVGKHNSPGSRPLTLICRSRFEGLRRLEIAAQAKLQQERRAQAAAKPLSSCWHRPPIWASIRATGFRRNAKSRSGSSTTQQDLAACRARAKDFESEVSNTAERAVSSRLRWKAPASSIPC